MLRLTEKKVHTIAWGIITIISKVSLIGKPIADVLLQKRNKARGSVATTFVRLPPQAYTVENYCRALRNGTKHIYQMLPRMLTIWLDLGERVAEEDGKKRRSRLVFFLFASKRNG